MKCNECGNEVQSGWKVCPFCGAPIAEKKPAKPKKEALFDFPEEENAAPQPAAKSARKDDLFGFSDDDIKDVPSKPKKSSGKTGFVFSDAAALGEASAESAQKNETLARARIMCIRGNYEEALKAYDKYVSVYFDDPAGYIGQLRVHSEDFTIFESPLIDKDLKVIKTISKGKTITDAEYLDYLSARSAALAAKKKAAEEAARKKAEEEAAKKKAAEEEAARRKAAEEAAKKRAEEAAKKKAEEEAAKKKAAEEAAKKRAEEAAKKKAEAAAAAKKRAEEEERRRAEAERRRKAEEEERRRIAAEKAAAEKAAEEERKRDEAKRSTMEMCATLKRGDYDHTKYIIEGKILKRVHTNDFFAYVPEGVTEIGASAFEGCSSLDTVVLPDTVKIVRECAFKDCVKLTTITLGKTQRILRDAFVNCPSITSLQIPDELREVSAFCTFSQYSEEYSRRHVRYRYADDNWHYKVYFQGKCKQCKLKFNYSFGNFITIHCTDGDINYNG